MKENYKFAIKVLYWLFSLTIIATVIVSFIVLKDYRELIVGIFSILSSSAAIVGLFIAFLAYRGWKNQINFDRSMSVIERLRTKLLSVIDLIHEFDAEMISLRLEIRKGNDIDTSFLEYVNEAYNLSGRIVDEIGWMETIATSPQIDPRIERSFIPIYENSGELYVAMSCLHTLCTSYITEQPEETISAPVTFKQIEEMIDRVSHINNFTSDLLDLDHQLLEIGLSAK